MYFKLIWVSIRAQMQYRTSFILLTLSAIISSFIEFVGIWAFFTRFGTLGTWTIFDVGVFYGMGHSAFALCEMIARGFDTFHNHVRTGDFDRTLLRPRGTVVQVMGSELDMMRVGRLIQGMAILLWSCANLEFSWGISHWLLCLEAIIGGFFMFSGVIVMQATACFWTVESIEIWNILTYGGVTALQYPMDIYHKAVRYLFTYLLPLAAINFWPCAYLLNKTYCPVWWSFTSPLLGLAVFLISLAIWRFGVHHYRSTGS